MQLKKVIYSTFSLLSRHIKTVVITYIFLQLLYAFIFPQTYTSDALYYYNLAQECVSSNEFYPAQQHLFEDYIVAPLYINIVVILVSIYNSTLAITLFKIIINLLQLLFISKITEKYFDKNIAVYAVLIYIFYLNTLGLVFLNYTELFFTFLILASIYFYSFNKKLFYIISGLLIASAIAIRPVGWALLASMLIIDGIYFVKEKRINRRIVFIFAGLITFITLFGAFNYTHFKKFIFTSTTGPVNLLLGANETATGAFDSEVFEFGNRGYIANPDLLTYTEKGDYYYELAIEWIRENPVKWIALMPMKLFHTFSTDDIAISALLRAEDWNVLRTLKILLIEKDASSILGGRSFITKVFYSIVQIITHIYYYLLLIILILGLIKYRKKINFNHPYLLPLLFVLIGLIMIMVTVGTPRYKYPFVIIMIPFAANYLYQVLKTKSVES